MFRTATEGQVTQLQDNLNSLEKLKEDYNGSLQAQRALREAKSQIKELMGADSFRAEDRQAMLDDLNNLGAGGGVRRGGGLCRVKIALLCCLGLAAAMTVAQDQRARPELTMSGAIQITP
jgi:hypothetical protein